MALQDLKKLVRVIWDNLSHHRAARSPLDLIMEIDAHHQILETFCRRHL